MKKELKIMTKFKINLIEAPDEMSDSCPFGRAIMGEYDSNREQYNFDYELNLLIEKLNSIDDIDCKKNDNTSIIIESPINNIKELQKTIKPPFSDMICRICYDDKNPIEIINK